ncbi:hypothetical protein [Herbaspirillum huttiense]|uniref:hypothetical protein n=1 Tax=Herbaspirillum huttiense TaxID=863372 RepID=UPI003CF09FCA
MQKYVLEGAAAYFSLKGMYRNPYGIGSEEFNDFERGWMQSLKRDDAKLAARAQAQPEIAAKNYATRSPVDNAALYRNRKG